MKKFKSINTLPENATYDELDSPVGILTIIASIRGLHAVLWDNYRENKQCEKFINSLVQSKNEQIITKNKKTIKRIFPR